MVAKGLLAYFVKNPWKFYLYLALAILAVQLVYVYATRFERTIKIAEKYHYADGRGRSLALNNAVVDDTGKVYRVANSLFLLEFRSAEALLSIKPNQSYKVKGYGIRIPILGMFPTIVRVEPA